MATNDVKRGLGVFRNPNVKKMDIAEEFYKANYISDRVPDRGNVADVPNTGGSKKRSRNKAAKTFEELSELNVRKKSEALFSIFRDLYSGQQTTQSEAFKDQWEIYAGNDGDFKAQLGKFFGGDDYIYNGMELNSLIKSIATKLIQPFQSKDDLLSVNPLGIDVETADRLEILLNQQLVNEGFMSELYKVIKDGLIHGIGFMSIGWDVKVMQLPKRVLKKEITGEVDNSGDDEFNITVEEETLEEVVIEKPDFKADFVGHIYYPKAPRWKDVPYVVRKELLSKRTFNERYGSMLNKEVNELERNQPTSQYKTDFEIDREILGGSSARRGRNAVEEMEILHYYFKDGSYYVTTLNGADAENGERFYDSVEVIYEGVSPVPGMAIPILAFEPEPITNRIGGESLINVAQHEQRKITELSNLVMRMYRNKAAAPIVVGPGAGLNIPDFMNRTPNRPISIEGDINEIKKLDLDPIDTGLINYNEMLYNSLQRVTGQSDFSMGNIGKSARLTGVDSLIGMAMSRLSMYMSQLNKFILDAADSVILLNRAFLPKDYAFVSNGLYSSLPTELLEIPYPLNIKIKTAVSNDKSTLLAGYREALQWASALESAQPGTVDLFGLLREFFNEVGLRNIGRYFLKSPMTLQQAKLMRMVDSIAAQQQSSLAGTPTQQSSSPQGQYAEQPGGGSVSMGNDVGMGGIDGNGQSGSLGSLQEQQGQAGV